MSGLLQRLSEEDRKLLRRRKQPPWTAPMLATLTKRRFSDPDWIFERKLDGERCLALGKGGRVRLVSRNRNELNRHYPELVEALRKQTGYDLVADGEIVAFEGSVTSFQRLQQRMQLRDPQGSRKGFGALLVGYYEGDRL